MSSATKALADSIKGNTKLFGSKNSPSKNSPGKNSPGKTPTGTGVVKHLIFNDFCNPAKFYLIIALVTLMYYVYNDQAYIWIILKAILFIGWGFMLNKLCQADFNAIAWVFAIIPQCVFIFFTLKVSPALPRQPNPPPE